MFETTLTHGITYRTASEINSAMTRVYGHMSLAVIVSMIVSYFIGSNEQLVALLFTGVTRWFVILSPLAAIFVIMFVLSRNPSRLLAQSCLYGFAALMGLSFSLIFAVFTMGSVVSAFMGSAVLFVVMTGYGYFTKQNLDSLGRFVIVGLVAVIIASIVNLFVGSTVVQMVISAVSIIVFLGLTAYDTQKIREEISVDRNDAAEIRGALILYMDFINLFLNLLQLFGSRKE